VIVIRGILKAFWPIGCLLLASCSWFGIEGNEGAYLKASVAGHTRVPADLDEPPFVEMMTIPPIDDVRNLKGKEFELQLPEALSTSYGVDQIVLRKLDKERWIFLDAPPETVWNKVKEFLEANNVPLEVADAGRGIMETPWLLTEAGDVESEYESLRQGRVASGEDGEMQNRFRLRVEPGVRSGSTEVHLVQINTPVMDWPTGSDNDELAGKVLSELAYYLGDQINRSSSISLLAGSLSRTRAELIPDVREPVLKYYLDFNRAWSTVGSALKSARIPVEDINRSAAVYYVYYDDGSIEEPGFFRRLFSSEEGSDSETAHRYQVRLNTLTNQVHVTVHKDDDSLADAFIAERLLKVIKEYSS